MTEAAIGKDHPLGQRSLMTRNGKTGPMSKEASHIFEKIQRGRKAVVRCESEFSAYV